MINNDQLKNAAWDGKSMCCWENKAAAGAAPTRWAEGAGWRPWCLWLTQQQCRLIADPAKKVGASPLAAL